MKLIIFNKIMKNHCIFVKSCFSFRIFPFIYKNNLKLICLHFPHYFCLFPTIRVAIKFLYKKITPLSILSTWTIHFSQHPNKQKKKNNDKNKISTYDNALIFNAVDDICTFRLNCWLDFILWIWMHFCHFMIQFT